MTERVKVFHRAASGGIHQATSMLEAEINTFIEQHAQQVISVSQTAATAETGLMYVIIILLYLPKPPHP